MTNHFVATTRPSWGLVHPIDGDPPDISFELWERIKVDDRVKLARAQLEYQKAVLQAQLDLIQVFEGLANVPVARQ